MSKDIVERKAALPVPVGDVEHGGLEGSDFEIPRATLLQSTSPDVKDSKGRLYAGLYINSITKEVLPKDFIPLLTFKQYAKFTPEGKLEWSTIDKKDPRVVDGLEWKNNEKPEVTEFINVVCVFGKDTSMPVILSFKRTAFRIGKQFLTLLSMKKDRPLYGYSYNLESREQMNGSQSWSVPRVTIPSEGHVVPDDVVRECEQLAKTFAPIVRQMKVDDEVTPEEVPF